MTRSRLRREALAVLQAGLAAADPRQLVRAHLACDGRRLRVAGESWRLGRGRLALVAAGKAASSMAQAAEEILGNALGPALVVDTAARVPLRRARRLVAGHPMPDERGLAAAAEVEALARSLGPHDLLLLLLSGGASALLPAPVAGVSLADKARTTRLLMDAGAGIHELNTVRKHLSRLKGGGLARLCAPARLAGLVLSDVIGDDLATIASGPAWPDPTTYADALAVVDARGLRARLPRSVRRHLEAGAQGQRAETPKPGAALFRGVSLRVVGGNRLSLQAALREARRRGLRAQVLTGWLEGEAREAARVLVALLREQAGRRRARGGLCLLAGGETTVSVRGPGRGGRNQELVVAAVEGLARFTRPAVVASLATDGIDGRSDAAGGLADDRSLLRAKARGLGAPAEYLARSDSRAFLAGLGDLIVTGPTGTNVVDLTVLLA